MLKGIIGFIVLWCTSIAFAQVNMTQFVQVAGACHDMECVDNHLDTIDSQITALLGERMAYVQVGAKFLNKNQPLYSQARYNEVLNRVTQEAQMIGYPPIVARVVFSSIVLQSNVYSQRFQGNF